MFAVKGIYDGVSVKTKEKVPFNEKYEVIITFVKPKVKKNTAEKMTIIRSDSATGRTILPMDMYYEGDDVYAKLLEK